MHYCFVIIDDFSRFTYVYFLTHKHETFDIFETYCKKTENEHFIKMTSDHDGEFVNARFDAFCNTEGYLYNFSSPRTLQQYDIVERMNRLL